MSLKSSENRFRFVGLPDFGSHYADWRIERCRVYCVGSDRESVLANAGAGSSVPQTIIRLWLMVLRYVAPLAIVVVFINSLGLI